MKPSASPKIASFMLSLLVFATLSPFGFAQAKRAMTIDDVMQMRTVSDPRLSPDGRTVAFVVTETDVQTNTRNSDVWTISADGGEPHRLTNWPKRDDSPQWSIDSQRLAFISDRDGKAQVYVISIAGGEAQKLTDVKTAVQSFAWSPDGKRIAYIATEPVSAEREKEKKAGFDQTVLDKDYQLADISVIDVPSKMEGKIPVPTLVTDHTLHVTEMDWSPDGKFIAITARHTPKLSDSLTTEIYVTYSVPEQVEVQDPRFDKPFKDVFIRYQQKTGGPPSSPRAKSNLIWSPDGNWLSYLATTDKYPTIGPSRVHLIDARHVEREFGGRPFTFIPLHAIQPQFTGYISRHEWSPDSKFIYFTADVGVGRHLYRMAVDGDQSEQLTADDGLQGPFSLSEKADRIAFIKEDATHPADVWIASINADAKGSAALTNARQLTHMNPQSALFALGRTEVIRWKSSKDNREIEGLLVYPLDYDAAKRYPLITSLHGGPEGAYQLSFMAGYSEFPHVYAARSYLSFFPNFRGSSNYGAAFAEANVGDLGGGDYQDVMSGIDTIIQRGLADPDKLAIKGYSYGGYLAGWIIGHTTRFKAAAFGAGLSNAISYYSTADIQYQREVLHQGTPWRNNQNMLERSPVFYLQNARTPSLIYHGEKDERVPLGQSMETYMGLKQAGVTTEMVVYPGEGHGLREPAHQLDKMRREMAWIEKYIHGK